MCALRLSEGTPRRLAGGSRRAFVHRDAGGQSRATDVRVQLSPAGSPLPADQFRPEAKPGLAEGSRHRRRWSDHPGATAAEAVARSQGHAREGGLGRLCLARPRSQHPRHHRTRGGRPRGAPRGSPTAGPAQRHLRP